jgi:hypothetical protein|tara:strand:+ start:449 stop:1054 length:606 start_codon:yes stop_codon:yes gene_type:complete
MATVEESYLDKLKDAIRTDQVAAKARAAGNWFRSIVNRTRGQFSKETPQKILSRQDSLVSKSVLGKMYFYSYNPKWKDELPWYDTFPLVFPIERYPDGFLGLNFHYLAPKHRAILMDQLKMFANNKKYDETTKLRLSYNMLKGFTKIKRAKPTVHRYLNSKVNSKFVLVNADEWEVALFLPVERFKKATKKQVWAHSGRMF